MSYFPASNIVMVSPSDFKELDYFESTQFPGYCIESNRQNTLESAYVTIQKQGECKQVISLKKFLSRNYNLAKYTLKARVCGRTFTDKKNLINFLNENKNS
jgi:hypothetical protein